MRRVYVPAAIDLMWVQPKEIIHIELWHKCHPFYTGEQRFIDSASRIQNSRISKKLPKNILQKKVKKIEEKKKQKDTGPKTLREMLMSLE